MSEFFEPTSDADWRLTREGSGLLATFNAEHLLNASDVHVATRIGELGGESDDRVLLAVALAVRAVRRGSVCLDLATAHESAPQLSWPDPAAWQEAVVASPLVEAGVVRWDLDRLYLDRYHRLETQVCDDLRARTDAIETPVDESRLEATAALLRGRPGQRAAAAGRDERRSPPHHDPHRRARHRQDHHGRPDAGAARRPGRGP